MKILKALILGFLISSCNKALFVSKKNVVYRQKGYIVFYYKKWAEGFFFPCNDTTDNKFLSHNHLNGFRLYQEDLDNFSEIAETKIVQQSIVQNGEDLYVNDSIKILRVEISYYWGDAWKLHKYKDEQVNIKYIFQGKQFDLLYTIYDDRHILWIHPFKSPKIEK